MKIIVSPSKEMDFKRKSFDKVKLTKEAKKIINVLSDYSKDKISKVFKIKGKILDTVFDNYENYQKLDTYNVLDIYSGRVFKFIDKDSLSKESFMFLNSNLIVLSALYGPLKAMDSIKPYRLDFNIKLDELETSLEQLQKKAFNDFFDLNEKIFNLASLEFSKLLDRKKLNVIDFEFYELKNDKLKKNSMQVKKARGLMVRFLAENNITSIEKAKLFNIDGYLYSKEKSNANNLVFIKN